MDFDDILDDVLEEFAEEESANLSPAGGSGRPGNPAAAASGAGAGAGEGVPANPDVASDDYLAAVSRVMQQLEDSENSNENNNNQQIGQPAAGASPEDMMTQMLAGLGLGGGGGNPQEMAEFTEMMQQLLQDPEGAMQDMMKAMMSKEMMDVPMKDFATRYETWIAEQKTKDQYSAEQIEEFQAQLELVQNIVKAFENDDEQTAAELFTELTHHREMPEEFGQVLMSSLMDSEAGMGMMPPMGMMDPNNPLLQPPVDAEGNPLSNEEMENAFAEMLQMMAGGAAPPAGEAPNLEDMTDEERAAFLQQQMPNCPQQ